VKTAFVVNLVFSDLTSLGANNAKANTSIAQAAQTPEGACLSELPTFMAIQCDARQAYIHCRSCK